MKNFWNYFTNNQKSIENLPSATPKTQKQVYTSLEEKLNQYDPNIEFIFIFSTEFSIIETKRLIFLTDETNAKKVTDLINNAPKLQNWRFTTFTKSTAEIEKVINQIEKPIILQDILLKNNPLIFLPINPNPKEKNHLILFLKNFVLHSNTRIIKQLIFIILQDIICQETLFQNVSFVQLAQLPNSEKIIYLYDLQLYIDQGV